mmetsp:Transcript_11240/g.22839  ORF Transcript_11240/g.22839 Transcript_11240/m.22839 type:complete len:279 (+) Transcript_11240:188-1024(+)
MALPRALPQRVRPIPGGVVSELALERLRLSTADRLRNVLRLFNLDTLPTGGKSDVDDARWADGVLAIDERHELRIVPVAEAVCHAEGRGGVRIDSKVPRGRREALPQDRSGLDDALHVERVVLRRGDGQAAVVQVPMLVHLLELWHRGGRCVDVVLAERAFGLVGLGYEVLDLQLLVQGGGQRQRRLQGPGVRRHHDVLDPARGLGVLLQPLRGVLRLLDPALRERRIIAHEVSVEAGLALLSGASGVAAVLVAVADDVDVLDGLTEAAQPKGRGRRN